LPLALLEAMSMSCAVIATDAGGAKEVIRPEVDGMLCTVNRPEALVDFAVELLGDAAKRKRFRRLSRARIEDTFSLACMVRELERTYKLLVFSA